MNEKRTFEQSDKECDSSNNCHEEFYKRMEKVREIRQKSKEIHKSFQKRHDELHRFLRYIRYLKPIGLIVNLIILYLIFRWLGVKTIGVIIAALLILKEIGEIFFVSRLEKRVIKPIDKLKKGVEEIARGNYNVKVECDVTNDIGLLVDSFNDMAQKLQESDRLKIEYEENRKMLIANISHDLKTPITSIQGYIEAVLDGSVVSQENINKYLKVIYSNSDYINRLIDDLFLFSKLDMQKLDFNFETIRARPFMRDIMEEFKFELEEKQYKLNYEDKMDRDCDFRIDRKRLHQAFRNIIGNALKYGPEGDLEIAVYMYRRDNFIYIDIKDNGSGIPEDKLPYIFDRFYRVDNERQKDLMSTGLGLSIAKELVEAHGGEITALSIVNEGTCFTIAIPIS